MAANVAAIELSDDLVTQFCNVTGANREVGRQLLEACHGNLEMAIGVQMDQDDGHGIDRAIASSSGTRSRSHHHSTFEPGAAATASDDLNGDGLRAPIPQRHEILVEEAPKLTTFRGRRQASRSVFDGFRDFQAETRQQENMLVSGRPLSKKNSLEDLFRPPIDITFKGTFQTARDAGKSQNRWLLVNVHNVQEFSCQVLNRDIWSSSVIKGIVKKHFIFWQVYHDSSEGKKFMQFYTIKNWPHVAIIDPVTGENMITWDKVELSSFPDLLRDFVDEHPGPENPDGPPAKRQKRENSIVDESEEAQLEAAIKASLSQSQQHATATSSASTISIPSELTATIGIDSDPSDSECEELETFTGSEDETIDAPTRHTRSHSRERPSSQQRNISALPGRSCLAREGISNVRTNEDASSSGAGAAGVIFPRQGLSASAEDSSLPSTSGSRDIVRIMDDSENENSLGFRESYANTPNSVDIMGGRSWECHNIDSSSNSSSFAGSGIVTVDIDEDTVGCDRLREEQNTGGDSLEGALPWVKYFGYPSDPKTNLVIRFPDGKKEQLSMPCSSKLKALFIFCSSKGFSEDSYELVVNFPRRTLSSLDPGSTLKDVSLHPQETIFVQAR